jgi:hypothetical protein
MSAPERDPNEWEFRVLGRVLFRLRRRVLYLIVLGLSIGGGLKSPDAARNFIEGTVEKLLRELREWRLLAGGIAKWTSPFVDEGGSGVSGDGPPTTRLQPDGGGPVLRRKRLPRVVCYADADRLDGRSLRLREAACSNSPHRRTLAPETGRVRLTGRYAYCLKHGVWWTWSEVIYDYEVLWAARYYLRCYRQGRRWRRSGLSTKRNRRAFLGVVSGWFEIEAQDRAMAPKNVTDI